MSAFRTGLMLSVSMIACAAAQPARAQQANQLPEVTIEQRQTQPRRAPVRRAQPQPAPRRARVVQARAVPQPAPPPPQPGEQELEPAEDLANPQPGQPGSATGPVEGYVAGSSLAGIKTDTPIVEIPQSISIVTADQIQNQAAQSVQEALRYTAGVYADSFGPDTRGDFAQIRGSDPLIFLDGLRQQFGFYNNTRIDPYTLERIEVIKGPASVLYGRSSTAGIVNAVSKRPQAAPYREVGVEVGSFDRMQIFTDMTGPLNENATLLYRLVAVGRVSEYQTDFVDDDRWLVQPSITMRPTRDTTLTLLANFQEDRGNSSTAFLPIEGTLFAGPNGKIPINRFASDPRFDEYNTESASITALFEHKFTDNLAVRQNLRYVESSASYQSAYPDVFSNPANPFVDPERRKVNRFTFFNPKDADVFVSDSQLEAKLNTSFIEHKMLFGFDYTRFEEQAQSGFALDTQPFDLYDPVYFALPRPELFDVPEANQYQRGFYFQDQMRVGNLIGVVGLRRDEVANGTEFALTERSEAATQRYGLMYELPFGLTPYLSYAESFDPIAGLNRLNQPFDPIEGVQREAGLKYLSPDKRLLVTASVYDIVEQNRLAPDPVNPLNSIQTGEAEFQGFDIEAQGKVTENLSLLAAYAYTEALVTEGVNAGFRVSNTPENLASLWAKYDFGLFGRKGYWVGAGVRYVGETFDGADNFKTPSFTLFDAGAGFENETWRMQVNGSNLEDEIYLSACLARGDCFYGTRRKVTASLTRKF